MKNKFKKVLIIAVIVFSLVASSCGSPNKLAKKKDLITVDTYNIQAYLQPLWNTREIYNETIMFVGKESSVSLMYKPSNIISVRNYGLDITYTEGKDYTLSGKTITRTKDSAMPYFEIDEYYRSSEDAVSIPIDREKVEQKFDAQRYLKYGEGDMFTSRQMAVTYSHDDAYNGFVPASQEKKFSSFIQKLGSGNAEIMFYGDSITTGCNASGTISGGNVSPYTPSWTQMVCDFLKEKTGSKIKYMNEAVGGWTSTDGINNFEEKALDQKADLLILAFGMNDSFTRLAVYEENTENMIKAFLKDNPGSNVLLVSSMLPNTESTWLGNQRYFEETLNKIAKKYENVAVAPVCSMSKELENMGKKTRDYLANNINHPNDFGVRMYAQVILKTLMGDKFHKETFEQF